MEQYERSWKNYYEILQVSPKAEPSVITAAYKRLAQQYHPDVAKARVEQLKTQINYHKHRYYGLDSPEINDAEYDKLVKELKDLQSPQTSTRMADINEAYEVLSNPVRRSEYDRVFKTKHPSQEAEAEAPTNEEIILGLMRYAAQEAAKGKKRSQVADDLTRQGVPYDVAARVVNGVYESRSKLKRKEGLQGIGCGLLMLVVGGIITSITYSAASGGGTYIITTGLFIVGALTLIVGFIRWITS